MVTPGKQHPPYAGRRLTPGGFGGGTQGIDIALCKPVAQVFIHTLSPGWHCQVVGDDSVTRQQQTLSGGNVR
jgi:hypothetical protein